MGMFSYISSLIYGNPEEHCCTCDDLNENTVTFKNQQIIDNVNQILSSPKLIDPTKRNGYFTETIVTKVNDSDNLIITDSVEIYAGEWYNGLKHGEYIPGISSYTQNILYKDNIRKALNSNKPYWIGYLHAIINNNC